MVVIDDGDAIVLIMMIDGDGYDDFDKDNS